MPDQITELWLTVSTFAREPAQSAALCAIFMSSLRVLTSGGLRKPKRWIETLMVGFLAWTSLPFIQHWGFEADIGRFFAAFLGYIGVHGFEKRVDRLLDNIADVASALRRK